VSTSSACLIAVGDEYASPPDTPLKKKPEGPAKKKFSTAPGRPAGPRFKYRTVTRQAVRTRPSTKREFPWCSAGHTESDSNPRLRPRSSRPTWLPCRSSVQGAALGPPASAPLCRSAGKNINEVRRNPCSSACRPAFFFRTVELRRNATRMIPSAVVQGRESSRWQLVVFPARCRARLSVRLNRNRGTLPGGGRPERISASRSQIGQRPSLACL